LLTLLPKPGKPPFDFHSGLFILIYVDTTCYGGRDVITIESVSKKEKRKKLP
jgi:hypothetical protein